MRRRRRATPEFRTLPIDLVGCEFLESPTHLQHMMVPVHVVEFPPLA